MSWPHGPLPISNMLCGNGSEEAYIRASDWISYCLENHEDCQVREAPLPTRVLDLDAGLPDHAIRLLETDQRNAHYVCLSHCWGKNQACAQPSRRRTTKANLERNKESIPLAYLPKTFRQAIQFTRKLGIQYLWIDSLCIIQDSHQDWQHEAALMGSIYENAFITIAATAASNDDEGFLRGPPSHYRAYQLRCKTTEGTMEDIHVRRHLVHFKSDWARDQPLLSRAWCFQERLLSPRVLHFAPDELWWECRTCVNVNVGKRTNFNSTPSVIVLHLSS